MATVSRTARVLIGQINKQFGKAQKTKVGEYIPSVFNHISREEQATVRSNKKVMFAQMKVVSKAIKGMGDIIFPTEQLAVKKDKLLEFAKKYGDKKLLRQISETQNGEELYKVCVDYNMGLVKNIETQAETMISKSKGKITLGMEQTAHALKAERAEKMFGLYEAIGKKSTNPEVLNIEQVLRQQYGMKNVNLQDDLARGEEILEVVKGLKAKGYPIPENVIVSDLHPTLGELVRANGNSTIILQSTQYYSRTRAVSNAPEIRNELLKHVSWDDLLNYSRPVQKQMARGVTMHSTTNPLHAVTHECLHNNHPNLIAFSTGKIPARFKPTVETISLYTNINKNKAEILTELETKLFLTGKLTEDEAALYKHIKKLG